MKYYIIAGEASGDLHASNLVHEIKKNDTEASFRGWGGDLMKEQGVEIVRHIRDFSFMGFTEVLVNLRTILKSIAFCKKDLLAFHPDTIILIDYPGFNLRLAKYAHENKIKVIYYISPQIWAWKQSRIRTIKAYVDKMMVILPFEKDFYKKFDYEVDFVGHPLLDAIGKFRDAKVKEDFRADNTLDERPIVALLPGSRKQEISRMLEIMLSVRDDFSDFQFIIAGAPSIPESFYKDMLINSDVRIVFNKTYSLLMHSQAALVTSGTATLETALLNTPEVVCYKGSNISYFIAKKLIKVKYISLVNLIMDRKIVTELIQQDLYRENLKKELTAILNDCENIRQMRFEFRQLEKKLGGAGASDKAAAVISKFLHPDNQEI